MNVLKSIKFIILISVLLISCNQSNKNKELNNVKIKLSSGIEHRKDEFNIYYKKAFNNILIFAKNNNWEDLIESSFVDSIIIYDNKKAFDTNILLFAGADTSMKLPSSFCGLLDKRTMFLVTPEVYSTSFPDGIEDRSYEKLITHELAHSFHIRILNGEEDAMGPTWFYEGFAISLANQFVDSKLEMDILEIENIMNNPEKGSYEMYGYIFNYFNEKVELREMLIRAKDIDFNEWLISLAEN